MSKIKNALPCSHCGGTDLSYEEVLYEFDNGDCKDVKFIYCKKCLSRGAVSMNNIQEEALKNWNQRYEIDILKDVLKLKEDTLKEIEAILEEDKVKHRYDYEKIILK
jgi:hypothetical protein